MSQIISVIIKFVDRIYVRVTSSKGRGNLKRQMVWCLEIKRNRKKKCYRDLSGSCDFLNFFTRLITTITDRESNTSNFHYY